MTDVCWVIFHLIKNLVMRVLQLQQVFLALSGFGRLCVCKWFGLFQIYEDMPGLNISTFNEDSRLGPVHKPHPLTVLTIYDAESDPGGKKWIAAKVKVMDVDVRWRGGFGLECPTSSKLRAANIAGDDDVLVVVV